jgi:hypothetical protein
MSTAEFIFGCICGVAGLGMFIWLAVVLHMAYTQLDLMVEHLKNSQAVMTSASLRKGGPWGKLMLVGTISGAVTFPDFHLRKGKLDQNDLSSFPLPIKRKLVILQWSGMGLFCLLGLLWLTGKIAGWHD